MGPMPALVNIGWTDVGGAGWGVLIAVGVLAAVVALLVWDARRRRSPSVLLDVTGALARMWVAVVLIGLVAGVVALFVSPWTQISELPVSAPWPTVLPCEARGGEDPYTTAGLDCASLRVADATAVGLSAGIRVALGAGSILTLVVALVPGVVLAVLCQAALRGTPFAPRTARWLFVGAGVVLVAGCGGVLLGDVGAALAARELLPAAGAPSAAGDAVVTARSAVSLGLPAWPVGLALGMAALGVVFRRGAQLQRDSEGLV
jgi:hypothetical protein